MSRILACIDGSSYAPAVCDYAAWLTGHFAPDITLLHAIEPADGGGERPGDKILADALSRLRDSGLENLQPVVRTEDFVDAVSALAPQHALTVLGKRGADAAQDRAVLDREALGSHVAPVIARTEAPVCVVSSLFLPISRVLVLLDADPTHRRSVAFLRSQPWLAQLETDVAIVGDPDVSQPKLDWARGELAADYADIFPLAESGFNAALKRYAQDRPVDLLVMSREVLAGECAPDPQLAPDSVWSWRTPVLVC